MRAPPRERRDMLVRRDVQSSPEPPPYQAMRPLPLGFLAVLLLVSQVVAQAPDGAASIRATSALLTAPGGRTLATVTAGARVHVEERKGAFARVTLKGYVDTTVLGGKRDSFAISVKGAGTVRLRAQASRSAAVVADLHAGMGLTRVSQSNGWAQVSRAGWVRSSALASPVAATAAAASTPNPGAAEPVKAAEPEAIAEGSITPARQLELRSSPDGRALATARKGTVMTPLARDRGWIRVRVEGWVPERASNTAASAAPHANAPPRAIAPTTSVR